MDRLRGSLEKGSKPVDFLAVDVASGELVLARRIADDSVEVLPTDELYVRTQPAPAHDRVVEVQLLNGGLQVGLSCQYVPLSSDSRWTDQVTALKALFLPA